MVSDARSPGELMRDRRGAGFLRSLTWYGWTAFAVIVVTVAYIAWEMLNTY